MAFRWPASKLPRVGFSKSSVMRIASAQRDRSIRTRRLISTESQKEPAYVVHALRACRNVAADQVAIEARFMRLDRNAGFQIDPMTNAAPCWRGQIAVQRRHPVQFYSCALPRPCTFISFTMVTKYLPCTVASSGPMSRNAVVMVSISQTISLTACRPCPSFKSRSDAARLSSMIGRACASSDGVCCGTAIAV